MIISLIFPYSAKFQKSGSFINSHSTTNAKLSTELPLLIHSTHQRVTPYNLAKLFHLGVCRHTSKINNKRYLLAQQRYHLRGGAPRNIHKIAIQFIPPSLWVYQKRKKRSCNAMLVEAILPINTINHQTILSLNTLTDK